MSKPQYSKDTLLGTRSNVVIWIIWHLLSAVCIVVVSSDLRLGNRFWNLPPESQIYVGGMACAYMAAAFSLSWKALSKGRIQLRDVIWTVAIFYSFLGLILVLSDFVVSRSVLMIALFLSFILAAVSLFLSRRSSKVLLPALLFGIAGVVGFSRDLRQVGADAAGMDTTLLATTFYDVKFSVHHQVVPSENAGGGLEIFGTGFLAAAGDGGLFYLDEDRSNNTLRSQKLPYTVPVNRDAFKADVEDELARAYFRVADILVQHFDERFRLFVSHHYWNSADRCVTARVSVLEASSASFLAGKADPAWKTLFETQPCLRIPEVGFGGHQIGGRLVELDDENILFSVGDHGFDGWLTEESLAQDKMSDYGKILSLNIETGKREIYSLGHRNPQGLHRMPDGRIWSTEHGPKGGDELNLIVRDANYGWPIVVYGAAYGRVTWPLSPDQGRHPGYAEPMFAWLPSIGISNVISVQKDLFPTWKGDLIVSSMVGRTLYRMRVGDRGIVFAEPISIDTGVRDLIEAPDGRIVLLMGDNVGMLEPVASSEEPDPAYATSRPQRGELLFSMCQDCHPISTGSTHGVGPDLRGIIGREIASAPNYDYSDALRKLSGTWTEERLEQFLEDPDRYAPGTSMQTNGFKDPASRADLIEYLSTKK